MLFGAQYDDEGSGPSPTQPRRKKTGSRRGVNGSSSVSTTPAKGSSSTRREKRNGATAAVNAPAAAATTFSPSSSAASYQSTSSSSLNSLNNENNNYNYNYNLGAIGRFNYAGEGFDAVGNGRLSTANTPVKMNAAATANTIATKRRTNGSNATDPVKRYAKLFGVLDEISPVPLPVDKTLMYPSVWKTLRFRKKMIQLATNQSVKPICVTGVDGFLGSWIVCELLKSGYRVRGTVQNRKDNVSGILALPAAKKNFTVVETSLLTPEACDMAVQGMDAERLFSMYFTPLFSSGKCELTLGDFWCLLITGCDFVIHTGTPSSCSVRDPLSEQQEPGVHSIGSRMHCIIPMMTNFIQACARARVKRVRLCLFKGSALCDVSNSFMMNSVLLCRSC